MREIIYRGLRKDGRGWAYGSYIYNPMDEEHYIGAYEPPKNPLRGLEWNVYEVDSETVGQFTGLADKNGRKIFEGDIIERRLLPTKQICTKSIAKYAERHAAFAINDINGNVIEDYLDSILQMNFEIEVIGNRWDNPELLEGTS